MQIFRAATWGLSYSDACYYGRRHSAHIGPVLILWGQMSEADMTEWSQKQYIERGGRGDVTEMWPGKKQSGCAIGVEMRTDVKTRAHGHEN